MKHLIRDISFNDDQQIMWRTVRRLIRATFLRFDKRTAANQVSDATFGGVCARRASPCRCQPAWRCEGAGRVGTAGGGDGVPQPDRRGMLTAPSVVGIRENGGQPGSLAPSAERSACFPRSDQTRYCGTRT